MDTQDTTTGTSITEVSIFLPLPPVELSKNGRAHHMERHEIFQQHKLVARSAINRVLPSGFTAWRGPVNVSIVWHQANRGHWPDRDNVIQRCAAYQDSTEDAGLIVNDKQIRSYAVDYVKDSHEGVSITFRLKAE